MGADGEAGVEPENACFGEGREVSRIEPGNRSRG